MRNRSTAAAGDNGGGAVSVRSTTAAAGAAAVAVATDDCAGVCVDSGVGGTTAAQEGKHRGMVQGRSEGVRDRREGMVGGIY